jgi:hypothetical protein
MGEELVGVIVVEVVGKLAEWTVVGRVGNGVAFGLPPPQAATTNGMESRPTMR